MPPRLPLGAHIWIAGGDLGPMTRCELVAADHVVPLTRHAIRAGVERLEPATPLAAGRQYQLRVRSRARQDIVGVWTVTDPEPPPPVVRCVLPDGRVIELEMP